MIEHTCCIHVQVVTGQGTRSSLQWSNSNLLESTRAFLNNVLHAVGSVEVDEYNRGMLVVSKEAMQRLGQAGTRVDARHVVPTAAQ